MPASAVINTNLSKPSILGYASGSIGAGIFSTVPGILLLYFLTDTLGVSPALAAVAVFAPKFWDVISDPLMGYISDHTQSRWGRRRPYFLLGAVLTAVSFYALFNVPVFSTSTASFYYVLVMFILCATSYTIFAVPYISMSAEMSRSHQQRTTIVSYRMALALTGVLIGVGVAPQLVGHFGGGRSGYSQMGAVMAVCCFLSMASAFWFTRKQPLPTLPAKTSIPLRQQLTILRSNRPFLVLVGLFAVQLTGIGTVLSTFPYFVVYVLGETEAELGKMLMLMTAISIIFIPLWRSVSNRTGKTTAFSVAIGLFAVATASIWLADTHGASIYWQMTLIGAGLGGIQMLPYAMLTDCIAYGSSTNDAKLEGISTGIWTATEKIGMAMGPLITGTILSLCGFVATATDSAMVQPDSVITGVKISIALAPAALLLLSLAMLSFYPLNERQLNRIESKAALPEQ